MCPDVILLSVLMKLCDTVECPNEAVCPGVILLSVLTRLCISDRAQAVFLDHVTRLEEVTGDIVLTRCLTEATGDGLVTRGGLPQEREGNPEEGGGRGREGATKRGKHRLEERGEGRTREQCQTAKQPCREKAKRRHSDQEGGEAVGKRKCLFQEERRSCLEKRGKRGKRGVSEKRLKPTDQQNAVRLCIWCDVL